MTKEHIYAKRRLDESGIDFKSITTEDILMACKSYDGIITKRNYAAILSAIDEIYKDMTG